MLTKSIFLYERKKNNFPVSKQSLIFAAHQGNAQMAKLVDALPSGGSVRKDVLVRIQFWALKSATS
jgi:hypothetical protein